MHSKHKGKQGVEYLSETDHLQSGIVLGCKVDQTQKEKEFSPLGYVEMSPYVFSLIGLAIYGHCQVKGMHTANCND